MGRRVARPRVVRVVRAGRTRDHDFSERALIHDKTDERGATATAAK